MRGTIGKLVRWSARLGLAGLFLWAGISKLLDPSVLAQDISHYRLLPGALIPPLALALPIFECVAGLALLTRTYVQGGGLLAGLMLAAFAAAMAQAKLRGIDLNCGCFGPDIADPVSWTKVAFDAGLAILAGWIAWTENRPSSALAGAVARREVEQA
jgi:putative oxidoreductase